MEKALPIGVMDYHKLISENYYNVDKSLMIKEFLERKSVVTLVTRPRRFGKTLNMSMMAEFFDITKDSKEIFKDTKIMQTAYASQINQYPTIFISFANAKGDKEVIVQEIFQQLRNEYDRYMYVFTDLTEFENRDYIDIKEALMQKEHLRLNQIRNALSFLMKNLTSVKCW